MPQKVLLETTEGNITIELASDMPITAGNFAGLVEKGVYNGVIFHRVMDGFMIQGGDPTGTGYGDPSIPMIKDEFNGIQENKRGTIAMANAGPNTGSSQFFRFRHLRRVFVQLFTAWWRLVVRRESKRSAPSGVRVEMRDGGVSR